MFIIIIMSPPLLLFFPPTLLSYQLGVDPHFAHAHPKKNFGLSPRNNGNSKC